LENAAKLGSPVPQKLRNILAQLKNKNMVDDEKGDSK